MLPGGVRARSVLWVLSVVSSHLAAGVPAALLPIQLPVDAPVRAGNRSPVAKTLSAGVAVGLSLAQPGCWGPLKSKQADDPSLHCSFEVRRFKFFFF